MPTVPHFLAPYAAQLDPAGVYTVRQIAALIGAQPQSVYNLSSHGFLPGARVRVLPRGGREKVWTGKKLARLAARPIQVTYHHDRYSPATLYRVGCRCPNCRAAHTKESQERKRALAEAAFPAEKRQLVLDLVEAQTPVAEAASEAGVPLAAVYGRALWDAVFAEALDEAGWSLCVLGSDDPMCSSAPAYRGNQSKRDPCRGTGCREWRRESSRQTRAAAQS
ncbi:hypothetical protein ABZV65_30390 [Streptomyces bauhiniae]|uniref:hypothetical protein n=1 Tax=Streptomyces bauhiniae TaxID=2340725 RepID=UPI0033A53EFE